MSDLDELYQSVILDHDRRPRNFRVLEGAGVRWAEGHNPLCGDRFRVMLRLEHDLIADASFQGAGCAISKASASLMTEHLKGLPVAEAERLFERFHAALTDETAGRTERLPAKLAVFRGVKRFPMRVKCATLPWHAMREALGNAEAGTRKLE
jgi:nitrogen fixation NifU-like protein